MEQVTLKAADGSIGKCTVLESKDGKVKVQHVESKKTYILSESVYKESIVAESVHTHHPAASVWKGQMVQVFEKDTQSKVDYGMVTQVTNESIFVNDEEYKTDSHDFLALG